MRLLWVRTIRPWVRGSVPQNEGAQAPAPKPRHEFWRRFRRHRPGMFGAVVLTIFTLAALSAPIIAPWGPTKPDITAAGQPPSAHHWLGTDRIGRDVFARVVYGGRVSISVAVVALLLATAIGIVLGGIAGYFGGLTDGIIMRFTDAIMCFPSFLLILSLATALPPNIVNVMLVLGLFSWPSTARLVRGQFLSIRNQDYVLAAKTLAIPTRRIIRKHILPNASVPILVHATLSVAAFIMAEAGLSFLGFGVREPMPSWGTMMSVALQLPILEFQLWLWLPPAIIITLTVLSVNFLSDGLMFALDPRLRRQR